MDQAPEVDAGYDEVGRIVVPPMLEGIKSRSWACELISLAEHDPNQLDAWIKRYRRENRESLKAQARKRKRRAAKIERLKAEANKLVVEGLHQNLDSREPPTARNQRPGCST
jgi:transposase-like protein